MTETLSRVVELTKEFQTIQQESETAILSINKILSTVSEYDRLSDFERKQIAQAASLLKFINKRHNEIKLRELFTEYFPNVH